MFIKLRDELGFTEMDFILAFDHFLRNFETYEADVPKLIEIYPLFVARAIYDEVLPCSYVRDAEMFAQN